MAHIIINADNCKACMLCMVFCPRDCIAPDDALNSRGFHPATLVDAHRCTGCRTCAIMCPDVCIEVIAEDIPPSNSSRDHS